MHAAGINVYLHFCLACCRAYTPNHPVQVDLCHVAVSPITKYAPIALCEIKSSAAGTLLRAMLLQRNIHQPSKVGYTD